jgi:hypothetical protein
MLQRSSESAWPGSNASGRTCNTKLEEYGKAQSGGKGPVTSDAEQPWTSMNPPWPSTCGICILQEIILSHVLGVAYVIIAPQLPFSLTKKLVLEKKNHHGLAHLQTKNVSYLIV